MNTRWRRKFSEVTAQLFPGEDVDQTIRSGLDRVPRLLLRERVHHCEFSALVCRLHQRAHGAVVEHRDTFRRPVPGAAVVVNDLDVVRAFGNPRIHKLLSLLRPGNRGKRRSAHLCWMPSRHGRAHSGCAQIRHIRRIVGLDRLDLFHALPAAEHIQLRGHAQLERLPSSVFGAIHYVHVRIDQPRQQRSPLAIDHFGVRRRDSRRRKLADFSVLEQHVLMIEDALAIEDTDVANELCWRRRLAGRIQDPENANHKDVPAVSHAKAPRSLDADMPVL